jgi:peptidyl-prolyl cis-trans isomerase D
MRKEAQLAGRMFGEDVNRNEFGRAYQNIYVSYVLMSGRPINVTEEIDKLFREAAWQRIAMLKKAKELGMTVSPQQTIDMIQSQPLFQNQQTGQFDKNAYIAFIQNFLHRNSMTANMTTKDLENMFAEQVLIEKVSTIPSQGSLVFEDEIKRAFHLYTDMLTVEYATIPRELAQTPQIGETEAKDYFNSHQEEFRMPEKVIVDYVQFAVADYTNSVEVTDEMVSQYYENNKQRYAKPPQEGADPSAPAEYQPLEEVQNEIREGIRMHLARTKATDKADELVSALADESLTFKKAAEQANLKIIDNTPAFTATDHVKGVDPTAPFQRNAFLLQKDASHYYSDPVAGRDFVYVLALSKKLDAFLPSFEIVRDDAIEAAKLAAAEEAYIEKSEEIQKAIKAAIKAGSSFSDAIAKYKLETKTTEPFNISSTLEDEFGQQIKQAAAYVGQGKVTDLISTPNGFLVAYVAKKVQGDEATALPPMRAELVDSINQNKARLLAATWREDLLKEAQFEDLTARNNDES